MPTDELLDPQTRERIRRETARGMTIVFAIAAVAMAALAALAHHEMPVLAWWAGACSPDDFLYECNRLPWDLLMGGIGLIVFGGFVALMYRKRRIPPTIECESCGGKGWVMDLEATDGSCPRCGGSTFTYSNTFAGVLGETPTLQRARETGMDGGMLLRRFRETRHAAFDRYY